MTQQRILPHLARLFGYAFSMSLDRDVARELVQECALRALRARRVPSDDAAYRAWLFRILRNAFIDQCRHDARNPTTPINEEDDAGPVPSWQFDESLINAITVRAGLRRLDPSHREIVSLIDISGFSYAEAADLLEVPVGTVMSRLSRARRSLIDCLGESNVHILSRQRKRSVR